MIKAIAKFCFEDSDRSYLNPKIDKGDRLIPERSVRSPLSKPQNRSMNTIMAQLKNSAQPAPTGKSKVKSQKSKLEQYLRCDNDSTPPIGNQSSENSFPKRERIKHLLIGSPKAVTSTIHYLQVIGYTSPGDWSPLQPTDNPDEVMSILIRHILMQ